MLSGDAQDQPAATRRECGVAQVRDDSSSASRRAKQNDASAPPCPARPSRACLASRTNRVPAVTRIGGRGDGAAVDDGPLCRRRADAAAPSSRGRDRGGRGPEAEECCDKQTEVEHRRASRGSPILCYLSIEPHGSSFAVPRRESGVVRRGDDSSSASRRAKQNDASAPPCPARTIMSVPRQPDQPRASSDQNRRQCQISGRVDP